MDAIKDDTTASLDELASLSGETIDFYRDLMDQLEDTALKERLEQAIAEQSRLIQALNRTRQTRGELPQAGDPERGHLLAILTTIRALAANNDSPVVERLRDANRDLCEAADNAAECALRPDERRFVDMLAASCRSLGESLRRHV